ncbi:DUF3566 domain-containing protein [Promicromonospora panici]|uniref:DUF3566 domain-containing protein n=1 Tax=Promicromonospora panici TaxID=2219658 RepID=UPI001F5D0528|nr:DUF3566 domain-containing protein [Promicromonospora panici]
MTSDKSGPVRTATPALDEDLDDTRVRKDVTGKQAPVADSGTEQTGASSATSAVSTTPETSATDSSDSASEPGQKNGAPVEPITVVAPTPQPASATKPATPAAKPAAVRPGAEPPAPPAPSDSGSTVPTTGGVWRSAYEAGRSGNESAPPAPDTDEATAPAGLVSAIGRASAKTDTAAPQSAGQPGTKPKSWNRVSAPPPAPPEPGTEGADGVRAGAMKAAQAALDAARSAAKKVSSIMPDEEPPATTPSATGPRPEMHYTAGGVRGTATPAGAPAAGTGQQPQVRPASAPTPEVPRPAPAGPRRVRLAISRVDPWSVMKLAFLLAVAIAIMTVVATAVFWSVLNSLGVFTTVQSFVADAVGPQSNVNLTQYVEFPRVISLATLISICNIVLLTAIATIMAFLYNITAALVGGVHMTLTDD